MSFISTILDAWPLFVILLGAAGTLASGLGWLWAGADPGGPFDWRGGAWSTRLMASMVLLVAGTLDLILRDL